MASIYRFLAVLIVAAGLASCAPHDVEQCGTSAPIYPDYTDITVPVNIAPLNFLVREDGVSAVRLTADGALIASSCSEEVRFGIGKWKRFLEENCGKTIDLGLFVKKSGKWLEYNHFTWTVSPDKVDSYLTYRVIEPDYEAYNNLVLQQRCVENFDTYDFSDHAVVGNKCMNCHVYAGCDPNNSMFYVRGKGGGAILNRGGELHKLAIKGEGMVSGSVYYGFSPSKRYIVFSTNKIIPSYHSYAKNRMEVFDTVSDVYVADLDDHKFISSPLLKDSTVMETFPAFGADGKHIYYCSAPQQDTINLEILKGVKYSLCRVEFDESSGVIGSVVDTVYNARTEGHSVCHPRVSPDGRFVCFSIADFGTFPLWHSESDLVMIDLRDGHLVEMPLANSDRSDTYHSWSSNSRWLVFASKRDDGVYGKPYFTHVDENGVSTKAFVLPQKNPHFYDNFLKSYNAPESGTGPLPFSVFDVKEALSLESETFTYAEGL